mgnify:CR=1 FL=1
MTSRIYNKPLALPVLVVLLALLVFAACESDSDEPAEATPTTASKVATPTATSGDQSSPAATDTPRPTPTPTALPLEPDFPALDTVAPENRSSNLSVSIVRHFTGEEGGGDRFRSIAGMSVDGAGNLWVGGGGRLIGYGPGGDLIAPELDLRDYSLGLAGSYLQEESGMAVTEDGNWVLAPTHDGLNAYTTPPGEVHENVSYASADGGSVVVDGRAATRAADGSIYIATDSEFLVTILGPDGDLVDQWTNDRNDISQAIGDPKGIAEGPNGLIYIIGRRGVIQIFKVDGTHVGSIAHGPGPGQLAEAQAIIVPATDRVVVTDTDDNDSSHNRIVVYDGNGDYFGHWNTRGDTHLAYDPIHDVIYAYSPSTGVTGYKFTDSGPPS